MQVIGSYHDEGYAHLRGLIPTEIAQAFMQGLKQDMGQGAIPLSRVTEQVNLLRRPAFEAYGHYYKPMLYFLWGLTPTMSQIVGRELLPTYDFLRIYRSGDVCHVHSDRYSCEHSLSLTLAYSDGNPWDLEVETARSEPSARVEHDFGGARYRKVTMEVGDALLYQGVHHRHGRTVPNPNRWSAHLFLHWVDKEGPYREHAFDGQIKPAPVDFTFA
ncbi:MAG TPA: hypothetical protein VFO69_11220 [Allosphingosinicella sp.]|nr:hypothetical protein [Allosphingosinicella sp.]